MIKSQPQILDDCPCPEFDCTRLEEPISESCQDPTTNPNAVFCSELADKHLYECTLGCDSRDCTDNCITQFNKDLDNCPCGENCQGF